MTRRKAMKVFLGLFGLGGIAGCGGGMNEGESAFATTPTLRIRVRLYQTERAVRIPRGSTVLAAISRRPFYYQQREDGMTIIKGICGHWRYAVNDIEPRLYAGNYRLTSNCRLDLYLL
ncbi:MAG: hypothetical protein CEN92_22 [Candidatus Berkelbacteria bacterium Licking1014_96]|uniref:Lipoprotein n=1 Tax=Candidatus Berkelbacteria bacterium Licking1014_96 TaxID=2017149 RepID=A0A554LHD6_9BACT|nr:MAG: hypothetical protein CEN92_22 [Candidatus Berkelbacteria bacterium Licking1014_96]